MITICRVYVGDRVLVEDTVGQGHITRSISDQPVRALFIPLTETELR